MTSVGAAYISRQPRDYEIHNSFGLMGNEHLLRAWTFKDEGCGCSNGGYFITLTDTRLLLRSQDSVCCASCCTASHTDASIFLRDIAEMRESTDGEDCCARCCAKCCACCTCCCRVPKYVQIRGSFGSEILHVSKVDLPKVQVEIPAAIGNHKLVSQY